MTNKDKEYLDLEKDLEFNFEEETDESRFDNLSDHNCTCCGNRLLKEEYEEFEDTCSDCMFEMTGGIIDDNPEEELE